MRLLTISLFGLFLLGCEPQVRFSEQPLLHDGTPSVLGFSIDYKHDYEEPSAKLVRKYNTTEVIELDKTITRSPDKGFLLTLPALSKDNYRLILTVPYRLHVLGIPLWSQSKTVIHDFTIHGPLSRNCFRFDNKEAGLQGWSVKGVFIGKRAQPVSGSNCPGLFYVNHSWPYPLNDTSKGGSLFVPVASNCFPRQGQQPGIDTHWAFTLLSPDLSNKQHWQHLNSISFRMATKSIPVIVSPEIYYRVGENKSSTYLNKKLVPHYKLTGGQWKEIKHHLSLPKRAQITQLAIHVLGVPEKTVGENVDSVILDGVCPNQ